MKARLGSLLVLATLVTASNAACSIQRLKRLPNEKSDECTDVDGGKHVLNTYWQKNCEWCFCEKTAITCCTNQIGGAFSSPSETHPWSLAADLEHSLPLGVLKSTGRSEGLPSMSGFIFLASSRILSFLGGKEDL
ncbi:beta-microseminoprotein isoform X2 [Rattus norvegicus]|uniref:beta-microseminoprotein isoform X1 n=1 Tax=Rattus norvegicus TaxID=10116 RepID=UPI002FD7BF92